MEPQNRIRELREARHLSLRDLAQKANMDVNKVHRLETDAVKLDLESMRRIGRALGVPASALLLDDDVEMRADEQGAAILRELSGIPETERQSVLMMARDLVRIVKGSAASLSAAALDGDRAQVGQLAETWNTFTPEARERALTVLQAIRP